jgi:diguanylate cyclase (GGDEF)-like protein
MNPESSVHLFEDVSLASTRSVTSAHRLHRVAEPADAGESVLPRHPPNDNRHRVDHPWHMRILPDALDRLREHPRFTLHDELDGRTAPTDAVPVHTVCEADREPTYHMELLRMFRQRINLVAMLGIVLLPVFTIFYGYLAPGVAHEAVSRQVLLTHGLMMFACIAMRLLSPRLHTLLWARLLSLIGYTVFCTGAAVVIALLSQNQFADESLPVRSIQLTAMAAHIQIMLSILLMPYTVWESSVVALLVTGSLAWSLWLPAPVDFKSIYVAQVFVLVTTAFFVLCVAHFQNILRRNAFDAAFDLARSVGQLQTLSTLDTVTGGFNRRYLEKMLSVEIARASRYARPLSVLMFDLDNFKQVNDTQGHAAGDEVLRTVWEAAMNAVREIDTIARYGGDEFVAVLPEADELSARAIADRLQSAAQDYLVQRFGAESCESRVTLSIGIGTLHPGKQMTMEDVLQLADERLYAAKREGKNRIVS